MTLDVASQPLPLPRYGESSLSDLMPSVLAALGVPGEVDTIGLPAAPRYCVLLVDGLGWELLGAHPGEAPFLSSLAARGRALTAGAPTTTATSLTSLGTGLPPGRHGIVGYTSRLPGTSTLLNALSWDQPIDPFSYQPYPTVFQRANSAGISVAVVAKRRFRGSGLTNAGLRGPGFRGADSIGERVAGAADAIGVGERSLVYVYDGDLDFTGHAQGCQSMAWRYQLAHVDRFAEQMYDELPPDAILVVTADHGMVDVAPERRVDVDTVPALREGVELIGGEARFRHVYTRAGAAEDAAAAWRSTLGERATVALREEAVAAGWFGAVESRVRERIGDVVVSVTGDCAVEMTSVFPIEAKLVGLHGALTDAELLIPLLLAHG